ncbi:hypothetical protein JTB14_021370 [Gonioctena quinquepunctata]|nr:hypothetical protein JTB14_021370 [Gonioctena quinquepunctata]
MPGDQKEDQPRKQISKPLSNLVLLKKKDVCVKADQPCMSSYKPAVYPNPYRPELSSKMNQRMPPHMKMRKLMNFLSLNYPCFRKSQVQPGICHAINSVSRMHSQSHGTRMEDRTDLRHKLATQVKESAKVVNHGTQTFKFPLEASRQPEVWVPDGVPPRTKTQQASDGPHQMPPIPLCYLRGLDKTSAGNADTLVTSDNPVANLISAPAVDDVEFVQRTVPVVNALAHGTISLLDVEAPEGCSYHPYWT